jgi:hypothetical protein
MLRKYFAFPSLRLHRPIFAVKDVREVLPEAIGTHSMGEVSLTVLVDVRLHLSPCVGLSSDLLAVRTDWQNTTEDFDLIQRGAQLPVRVL